MQCESDVNTKDTKDTERKTPPHGALITACRCLAREMRNVEIEQQANVSAGQSQIREQLCVVDGKKSFHRI